MLYIIIASLSWTRLSSTFSADCFHFAISAANSSLSRYIFLYSPRALCDSLRLMTIFFLGFFCYAYSLTASLLILFSFIFLPYFLLMRIRVYFILPLIIGAA